MLSVALAVVCTALAVVAVMAIPLSLDVHADWAEQRHTRWRIGWLFGLVDVELGEGKERGRSPRREAVSVSSPDRPASRSRRMSLAVAFLRTEGVVKRLLRLFGDLVRVVHVDRVHARAAFGLDDPADTGVLYGLLVPICLAANTAGLNVRCEALFTGPDLTGSCGGRVWVRPVTVASAIVSFACARSTRRGIRAAWRSRR